MKYKSLPACHTSVAQICGKANEQHDRLAYTHLHMLQYKYSSALRRRWDLSKRIYCSVLYPDALYFLNAMFPLWSPFF